MKKRLKISLNNRRRPRERFSKKIRENKMKFRKTELRNRTNSKKSRKISQIMRLNKSNLPKMIPKTATNPLKAIILVLI